MKTHSHFSLRYGILSPEEIVDWAIEAGYSSVFLADINFTGSAIAYAREAQLKGIHAVFGVELRNGMEIIYTLIAKNNFGFQELNDFLSSHLHQQLPFSDEIPDFENCYVVFPISKVPKTLNKNEFIEIKASELNKLQGKLKKLDFDKIIALEPMTFRSKRDFNTHRLLRAIDKNLLLSKLPLTEQTNENERFITFNELKTTYQYYPEFLERTFELFHSCKVKFDVGEDAKPQNLATYTDSKANDELLLRDLCMKGLPYRYAGLTSEIEARIDKEIKVIAQKDYLSYFLIAWDFTSYARSKGYFYVGRGSGANSLVAYLLRITDVDPLELDLYFERFINMYRKNPPDFDIDFSWRDRDDVIRYIFERFPNAAWICTYNTFQFRATIRELGKVFGLPKSEIDKLSRHKFEDDKLDDMNRLVLKYGQYIQGLPSHLSLHAGGIIISEKPVTWYAATFMPPKAYPATQLSMLEAEDVGLYKFDVLSQRGLGKIRECLEIVAYNQPENTPHDIHDIAYFKEDEKIRKLLIDTKALGCFYVESPAMRMLMKKLEVKTYLELVAASSIIRPGVSSSGMMREFILRHRNLERRKLAPPTLLEIMPETYGVMVYQEDVIKVAHFFAGLSLAESDSLRRGMSGKFRSRDEFQHVKNKFFECCKEKGHNLDLSIDIWRQIESFAGYAFSKGHSASYAVESYQSLYLKAHYPMEYMTATINNFGGYYRTEIYVHEARRWGAQIEAPSLNEGRYDCRLKGNRLILGFNLVAGIEEQLIRKVYTERDKNGVFTDFENLTKRIEIPLEQLSLLIRIGALRDFVEDRKTLLWKAHFHHHHRSTKPKTATLFATPKVNYNIPKLVEQASEMAFEQLELLGFTLCNPFDLLEEKLPSHTLVETMHQDLGRRVEMYGYLVAVKHSRTSKGDTMNFGTFLDIVGDTIDTVHFPESVRKYPFNGKGIYRLKGVITEEFSYLSLEVGEMNKLRMIDDLRFGDLERKVEAKEKDN